MTKEQFEKKLAAEIEAARLRKLQAVASPNMKTTNETNEAHCKLCSLTDDIQKRLDSTHIALLNAKTAGEVKAFAAADKAFFEAAVQQLRTIARQRYQALLHIAKTAE